jgi:hypothetical protein
MDEPEVIRLTLAQAGLLAKTLFSGMDDPAVKQQRIDNTDGQSPEACSARQLCRRW